MSAGRPPFTDDRWQPDQGGLPADDLELRADMPGFPRELPPGWPSPTAGSTITPPSAEPLSPYTRAELERIATDVEAALAQLRAFLRRP